MFGPPQPPRGVRAQEGGGGVLSLEMGTICSPTAWKLWRSQAKQAENGGGGGLLMTQLS